MKYVIANWKMYVGTRGGVALVKAVVRAYRGKVDLPEIVICPGFLAIGDIKKILSRSRVKLGAQDAFWEDEGAHTGFVGPSMLKEAGCEYVILGHSERRALGETNDLVSRKVRAALLAGLRVVLCVGKDVERELRGSLEGVGRKDVSHLLVVYEPEGAISSRGGGAADLPDVLSAVLIIRAVLKNLFGGAVSNPVLYGGSVDGENAYTYLREDSIDGVLVGSASVKIHHVTDVIGAALRAMKPRDL